jgi:signal transduction histidine kinase
MKVRSLRVRWMLMFMLVVMAALGIFAIFASRILRDQLQSYAADQNKSDRELIARVQTSYKQPQDIERTQALVKQIAAQFKVRIIIIDHNQHIIADSAHTLEGQTFTIPLLLALDRSSNVNIGSPIFPGDHEAFAHAVRIISTDGRIMTVGQPTLTAAIIGPVDHGLTLTVLVAGLVALVLTVALSASILKPVHALTVAARRMEQGDFSQRVKIKKEDEIGELAHAFNIMAESLEQSGQLQRNLVSDVAHELRTPLTNIRGYLEALQDQVLEPDATVIASLHEETMLLSRLVTDLQDLTLAEAGQLHLQIAPIALEDIISRAVNGLALEIESKDLSLCINVPADLPLVEADPQRVGQILLNLLNNAIKHTPSNGEIRVNVRVVQQEVEVRIQDTGVGIAAEHLPYIFKRFYRADPSRARSTGGTGLGLAIVEQLVHAHRGHVAVESQIGQGTSFTFTLPIALV